MKKKLNHEDSVVLIHYYDPVRKENKILLSTRKNAEEKKFSLMLVGMEDVMIPLFEWERRGFEK